MITIIVITLVVVLLALHCYGAAFASWHLNQSYYYFTPQQKLAQYLIIWLIPVLGTAFVLNILSDEVRTRRPGWVPWLDFMLVSSIVSSATEAVESAASNEPSAMKRSSSSGESDD